jgi:hypothetical protein
MIGASSVAGANTPLAIQHGNPVPIDKAVLQLHLIMLKKT